MVGTLRPTEKRILQALLDQPFPGQVELRSQLGSARVSAECRCGCASVVLIVDPDSEAPASTTSSVPVEAEGYDDDGMPVWFILHVRDGYLQELEIIRADGRGVHSLPDADTIAVTVRN